MSQAKLNAILRSEGNSKNSNTPRRKLEKTIDELIVLNKTLEASSDILLKNNVLDILIERVDRLIEIVKETNTGLNKFWSKRRERYLGYQEELNNTEFLYLKSQLEEVEDKPDTNLSKEDDRDTLLKTLYFVAGKLPADHNSNNFIRKRYSLRRYSDPIHIERNVSVTGDPNVNVSPKEQRRRNALNAAVSPYNAKGRVVYGNRIVPNPIIEPNTSYEPPKPLRATIRNGRVEYITKTEQDEWDELNRSVGWGGARRRKTRRK